MSNNLIQIDKPILKAFHGMAKEYQKIMSQFRSCKIGGEMSESNLVFTFLREFLNDKPNAVYAVEVPFVNIKNDHNAPTEFEGASWTNHLDAMIYHDQTLYLIEAKRDYPAKTYFDLIETDLNRIKSQALALSLHKMMSRKVYENGIDLAEIKAVKGILLADTWRKLNVDIWQEGSRNGVPIDWLLPLQRTSKSLDIYAKKSKAPYTLLITQTGNLANSLKIIKEGIQL